MSIMIKKVSYESLDQLQEFVHVTLVTTIIRILIGLEWNQKRNNCALTFYLIYI